MIETTDFEGVTQIRMSRELDGRPVYWVAAYLVDGLLIDTGCHHTSQELVRFLKGRDLSLIVNTHYHEDHMGANSELCATYKVEAFAHKDSIPLMVSKYGLYPYQEIAWGYPSPAEAMPVPAEVKTAGHAFKVVDTPGHCAGHVCLMELSEGWCFTGDLFAREKPKFIRPEENIGEIVRSMRKILDTAQERLVLFTSVGKIVEDGREALNRCIDYLAGLKNQVAELSCTGVDIDGIVLSVFGGEHPFAELTNGQFTTRNLVCSLLADGL